MTFHFPHIYTLVLSYQPHHKPPEAGAQPRPADTEVSANDRQPVLPPWFGPLGLVPGGRLHHHKGNFRRWMNKGTVLSTGQQRTGKMLYVDGLEAV